MIKGLCRRGQTMIEYAMVIVCIVAALLTMQFYIKRSIQGRVREAADTIGEQYVPGYMNSEITLTQTGNTTINTTLERDADNPKTKLGLKTTSNINENTTRTGYENVGKFENQLFNN